MNKDDLLLLYDYNDWANARIFAAAEGLDEAQLDEPADVPMGSLRGTLIHTVGAVWIWRTRCQGASPTALPDPAEFPTLAALRERWQAGELAMRDYLTTLSDYDLSSPLYYRTTGGKP